MKISDNYCGPRRRSNDFYNMIDQELAKLRKKSVIVFWAYGQSTGVLRLVNKEYVGVSHTMSWEGGTNSTPTPQVDADEHADKHANEHHMMKTFISILTRGKNANTYKFALAKALIEYCRDTPSATTSACDIPYKYLADKFLQYYWYQECRYKIKQDFSTNSAPYTIQAIRSVFGEGSYGNFEDVSDEKKSEGRDLILKKVFGHARSKTSIVVPRFQNITVGNKSILKKVFYEYDDDAKIIRLKPEAFDFFKANHRILSMAILSEWAKFLEKINKSLPMLVAKIEQDELHRDSLVKYRKMYLAHTRHCFYCMDRLDNNDIHVDHFLPWSYIFEDQPWNLVLACSRCNLKKSASLPQEAFQHDLVHRNNKYRINIRELDTSLRIIDTKLGWKKEIFNHYSTCKDYGFSVIRMP